MFASKRLISLLLLFLIAFMPLLGGMAQSEDETPTEGTGESAAPLLGVEGYELVGTNGTLNLYMLRDTLAIVVEEIATGHKMYSTVQNASDMKDNDMWKGFYQSGIVLEYIEGTVAKYPWANLVDTPHEKDITLLDNGFTADVHYTNLGITYTLTVTLEEWGVSVSIPKEGIREEKPEEFTVGSFYVYPFMGYSYMGEDGGYMIIPDGQGAIIPLQDNESRYSMPFSGTVYGQNVGLQETVYSSGQYSLYGFPTNNDVQRIMMPVFGMVHENKQMGFLGVIEEGDVSASIQAYPNGAQRMNFDWICAKYTYRVVYPQQTGPGSGVINMRTEYAKNFSIKQRFLFTTGEDANYTGLAKAYRRYLEEKNAFGNADEIRDFDIQIDFLGGERKNYVIGKQAVTMTSAEQVQEILKSLKDQSVNNILAIYKGWQEKGITGGLPTQSYNPAGNLGGKRGFAELFAMAKESDIRLYIEADLLHLNPAENGMLSYNAFKKVNNTTLSMFQYAMVYDELQFLTPSKSLEMGRQLYKESKENDVPGISLTATTVLLSDYYYQQKYFDSSVCASYYADLAKESSDQFPTVLHQPNAYLWQYANALTGLPIGGSDYIYVSQEIPFLSIALSGKIPYYAEYTNFQANTKRFFLQLVEQGARPSFYITWEDPILLQETNSYSIYSSMFSLYESMIVDWYTKLQAVHAEIGGGAIDQHTREGDGVTVTYDNGIVIYLNYSEKPLTIDGHTVEGLSYKVVNPDGR